MSAPQRLGPPIDGRAWFAPERRALLDVLSGLSAADWTRPTVCPDWTVADIAAHVLGVDLGRLARSRDDHHGLTVRSGEDLPRFLHRVNDEWVVAARRLSPELLIGALAWAGEQVAGFWAGQDLSRIGEPVTWAGPEPAPVWLDVAREFTEYWAHRQQIREALGLSDDSPPAVRHVVFDTFVRALPHTLRDTVAADGAAVEVTVAGPGGGRWTAVSHAGRWSLGAADPRPAAAVVLPGDTAWRLWTRGIELRADDSRVTVEGDPDLVEAVLGMVSIIR